MTLAGARPLAAVVAACLAINMAIAQRPLGTFNPGSTTTQDCPTGATCQNFTVSIPNVSGSWAGELAVMNPNGNVSSVDIFFSWESGTGWWWGGIGNPSSQVAAFIGALASAGHQLIFVRWTTGAWYGTPLGTDLGQLAAACRPATVIAWLQQRYPSSNSNLIGTSSGSCVVAYALADYGISASRAVVDSGPPFMEIKKGCENVSGYAYTDTDKNEIDEAYGFFSNGPCLNDNRHYETEWDANSVESGTQWVYPGIVVHIVIGLSDEALIQNRGTDYYNLLLSRGQAAQYHGIPHMFHGAFSSQAGLDAVQSILTNANPRPTPTPTPVGTFPAPD